LEKLEHNTLIHHGFITGHIFSVSDPESEFNKKPIKIKTKFIEPPSHKRKLINNNDIPDSHNNSPHKSKKQKKTKKKSFESTNQLCLEPTRLFSAGCHWDALNWSCAYDSVFKSLY